MEEDIDFGFLEGGKEKIDTKWDPRYDDVMGTYFNELVEIGIGGRGMTVADPVTDVLAMLLPIDYFEEAELDFDNHREIYQAVHLFQNDAIQVDILRPLTYKKGPVKWKGEQFYGYLSMERIYPPRGQTHLVHVMLSSLKAAPNALVGKNPARGFFAGPDYIQKYLASLPNEYKGFFQNVDRIAMAMGVLYAAMIGYGDTVPFNAEYVLGHKKNGRLTLFALNLGMSIHLDGLERGYNEIWGGRNVGLNKATKIPGVLEDPYLPTLDADAGQKYFISGMKQILQYGGKKMSEQGRLALKKTIYAIENYENDSDIQGG